MMWSRLLITFCILSKQTVTVKGTSVGVGKGLVIKDKLSKFPRGRPVERRRLEVESDEQWYFFVFSRELINALQHCQIYRDFSLQIIKFYNMRNFKGNLTSWYGLGQRFESEKKDWDISLRKSMPVQEYWDKESSMTNYAQGNPFGSLLWTP